MRTESRLKVNRYLGRITTVMLTFVMLLANKQALATRQCEGVGIAPRKMVVTRSHDSVEQMKDLGQKRRSQYKKNDDFESGLRSQGMIDIHTFNHFYTFQVDRDVGETNEGVVIDIDYEDEANAASQLGYAFRLRAEFNSALASRSDMGFKATFGYKVYDDSGYYLKPLAEVGSLEGKEGDGVLSIDLPRLEPGYAYQLRYEFGEKQTNRNAQSEGLEEDSIDAGDADVQCHLPYFTQELVFVDRKLLGQRVKKYNKANTKETDITKTYEMCQFYELNSKQDPQHPKFNSEAEKGINCGATAYHYPMDDRSYRESFTGQSYDSIFEDPNNKKKFRMLHSEIVDIGGVDERPITQYMRFKVGSEFAFGAGLKLVLRSDDDAKFMSNFIENKHPFACSLDQSCQIARRTSKNHLELGVIVTTGRYNLELWDVSGSEFWDFMAKDLAIEQVPFSFSVNSYPVLQNESRENCPFMYLLEEFIQTKYIDGQGGQRFSFSDKILINLDQLEQKVLIQPEAESILKVVIREQFGVNAKLSLCTMSDSGKLNNCHNERGFQIGTTEILYSQELQKGKEYYLVLDYKHSLIAMDRFDICPHMPIEISMITKDVQETLLSKIAAESGALDVQESKHRLSEVFKGISKGATASLGDKEHFTLSSETDKDFQVLSSYDFKVNVKTGIFAEIFYSPFQAEVLELFIAGRDDIAVYETSVSLPSSNEDGDFIDSAENQDRLIYNKYKSSKVIWVELEAGFYTFQILGFRPESAMRYEDSFHKNVNFQLYLNVDFINVSRESFLPQSLNYYGLLGYASETKDFGSVTLFYDDLTLWHYNISTVFEVQSESTFVSIQLEQMTGSMKMRLMMQDPKTNAFKKVGDYFHQVTEQLDLDTVEVPQMIPNRKYRVELYKDEYSVHDSIQKVEIGERYDQSFSLKFQFSENDDSRKSNKIAQRVAERVPSSINQVSKMRESVEDLHQSTFMFGNRNLVNLLTGATQDSQGQMEVPYVPKTQQVFTQKKTKETVLVSLPFRVDSEAELFNAGIYEATTGSNLLSLHVYEESTNEEVAISEQGKYFSSIRDLYLITGSYYFVIKNNKPTGKGQSSEAPLQYMLDVVRYKIESSSDFVSEHADVLQLCQLQTDSEHVLDMPGYLHHLSGFSINTMLQFRVDTLNSGLSIPISVKDPSLVTAYIETDSSIEVALAITESGRIKKVSALSTEQDESIQNFVHQKGYIEKNVVQLRAFIREGTYVIEAQSLDNLSVDSLNERENLCQSYKLYLTVTPVTSGTEYYSPDTEEQMCENQVPMPNQLDLNSMSYGTLRREITGFTSETSYFSFKDAEAEGPFFVYFQLDYDNSLEGVLGLVLFEYQEDSSAFKEVNLYKISEGQSSILAIVPKGTYAISIQTIASTAQKFKTLGFGNQRMMDTKFLTDLCFEASYTYLITSSLPSENSWSQIDVGTRVIAMETIDDLRNLREFEACQHQSIPQRFPISDEGFYRQYTFMMSEAKYESIELINEAEDLSGDALQVSVFVIARNLKNKVRARLMPPGQTTKDTKPIAMTDPVTHQLMAKLRQQNKAYHLVLDYGDKDPLDTCPLYDLIVVSKPLSQIANENLSCDRDGTVDMPPKQIDIGDKVFELDQEFMFSDEFILEQMDEKTKIMTYDIMLNFPHSDYFLDIQSKSDLLTNKLRMSLFAKDSQSEKFEKVGISHWQNENSEEDIGSLAEQDLELSKEGLNFIQSLRFLEEIEPDLLDNSSKLMLRLTVDANSLLMSMKKTSFYNEQSPLCFPFTLQIYASEADQNHLKDGEKNQLMRIDWQGREQSPSHFDVNSKLVAFLEFEKTLTQHLPGSAKLTQTTYLMPIKKNGEKDSSTKPNVNVDLAKLKTNQDNTLVLTFKPNKLLRAQCYQLVFANEVQNFITLFDSTVQSLPGTNSKSNTFRVCTSGCECDILGTKTCREPSEVGKKNSCICHPHYTGADCSLCEEGYFKNSDGYCEKSNACVKAGGSEDCNGHGTCMQMGDTAVCSCDYGFANDGLSQCARCSDPLMAYPSECENKRQWVLEQDDVLCEKLPTDMPRYLYKNMYAPNDVFYQAEDGNAEWRGRYGLRQKKNKQQNSIGSGWDPFVDKWSHVRKSSQHQFIVQGSAFFKLYFNTLESNVKARFAILDDQQTVVFQGDTFETSSIEWGTIKPNFKGSEAKQRPYTLIMYYQPEKGKKSVQELETQDCPKVEIHFILKNSQQHQTHLTCENDEIEQIKTQELSQSHLLDSEVYLYETNVVLSDALLKQGIAPKTQIKVQKDHEFLFMLIDLDVRQPGIFSAFAATDFSDLNVYIQLSEAGKNQLLAIEKTQMLDDVQISEVVTSKQTGLDIRSANEQIDLIQSVEFPELQPGKYQLKLSIPRGFWFSGNRNTAPQHCLSFDFVMEFLPKAVIKRDLGNKRVGIVDDDEAYDDDLLNDANPFTLVSMYPSKGNWKAQGSKSLMLNFDRELDVREVAGVLSDVGKICRLVSLADSHFFLNPSKYFYNGKKATLTFDFETNRARMVEHYKSLAKSQDSSCFKLSCLSATDQLLDGKMDNYIQMSGGTASMKYCFTDLDENFGTLQAEKNNVCNPAARAKRDHNGECICNLPYMGATCHQCASGYEAIPQKSTKNFEVVVCKPKVSSDQMECNGNGKFNSRTQTCDCFDNFIGDYCEECSDPNAEYPQCSEVSETGPTQSLDVRGILGRRKQNTYHATYLKEDREGVFQQQCPNVDYPNYLNQIQNHDEFSNGNFHIADTFVINHDMDNIIEFSPRTKGILRIMVKQPERYEIMDAKESMQFEIGVVKQSQPDRFIKTSTNTKVNIGGSIHSLDYDFSVLQLQIGTALLNEPLLIYFRGINYSHDGLTLGHPACHLAFLELEFRSTDTLHTCDQNVREVQPSQWVEILDDGYMFEVYEQVHKINHDTVFGTSNMNRREDSSNSPQGFFFSQDYYTESIDDMQEFEVQFSLVQKFIDNTVIIPWIEVLQFDADLTQSDIKGQMKPGLAPECKINCVFGGHKTYNQFTAAMLLPANTLFRVWLHISRPQSSQKVIKLDDTCSNFVFQLKVVPPKVIQANEEIIEGLHCEHALKLPKSLNIARYLGEPKVDGDMSTYEQRDFNYLENFRIDYLSTSPTTQFTLKEPTVIRIEGIEHQELQFQLRIRKGKKVVATQGQGVIQGIAQNVIGSIYTVLAPGDYNFDIKFMSTQADIIRQPCQAIQIQIAMNRAADDFMYPRETKQFIQTSALTLPNFFTANNVYSSAPQELNNNQDFYTILYDDQFSIEDTEDMNIAVKVSSDFLRVDINFLLINLSTGHVFLPQHIFESGKKLTIESGPGGIYRLVMFSQKLATNGNRINLQPQHFLFEIRLFSYFQQRNTGIQPVLNSMDYFRDMSGQMQPILGEPFIVTLRYITPQKLYCMQSGRKLPESLTIYELQHQTDFEIRFNLPADAFSFQEQLKIQYVPEEGEDILRLQINNDWTLKLYKVESNQLVAIGQSHNQLGNGIHEFVTKNLKAGVLYEIHIEIGDEQDFDGAVLDCYEGVLDVKIATSQSDFACLREDQRDWKAYINSLTTSVSLKIGDDQSLNMVSKGKPKGSKGQELVQAPDYFVQLQENADLTIEIDDTDFLFGAKITLFSTENGEEIKGGAVTEELGAQVISNLEGGGKQIEPFAMHNSKHMTQWMYQDLAPGKYRVVMSQVAKPASCFNLIRVQFTASPSIQKKMLQRYNEIHPNMSKERFISKLEDWQGYVKMPAILPLDLNSFRFLGGYGKEQDYLLYSDLIQLNPLYPQENILKLEIENEVESYLFKMYVEDTNVDVVLECIDEEPVKMTLNFIEKVLPPLPSCHVEIQLRDKTVQHQYLPEKMHITVMLAKLPYLQDQYLDYHLDALQACPKNEWPLALQKNMDQVTENEEQAYYNYPLIRFKQDPSNSILRQQMTTYYFRFNETQRFYFELGQNFLFSQATLSLRDSYTAGEGTTYLGKQIGNINVIDMDLAPGDYALVIQHYPSHFGECGLYSLRGILNQYSAQVANQQGETQMVKGGSVCEKKTMEELPMRIFPSLDKTRRGNEAVINDNGQFFHHYANNLIVKNHQEVLEPWTHEIDFELPDTSFVQILLQSTELESMKFNIFTTSKEPVKPVTMFKMQPMSRKQESKKIWKLEKSIKYKLVLQFSGDMYNERQEESPCAYFDMVIAINTLKHLTNALSCENFESEATANLFDVLPEMISSSDLDLSISGLYTIRYPEDFRKTRYNSQPTKDQQTKISPLLFSTVLDLDEPFQFSSKVAFDLYMADFELKLIQMSQDEFNLGQTNDEAAKNGDNNYEVVAKSGPLINLVSNDEETFERRIPYKRIFPHTKGDEGDAQEKQKFIFSMMEKQAFTIFDEVAKYSNVNNICLPLLLDIDIKKEKRNSDLFVSQSLQFMQNAKKDQNPVILDFVYQLSQVEGAEISTLTIPFNTKRVGVSFIMTQEPVYAHIKQGAIVLEFFANKNLLERFNPVGVDKENRDDGSVVVTFYFNFDLNTQKQKIRANDELALAIRVFDEHIRSQKNPNAKYQLTPLVSEKLKDKPLNVLLPPDFVAQNQIQAKNKQVSDALASEFKSQQMRKTKNNASGNNKGLKKGIINSQQAKGPMAINDLQLPDEKEFFEDLKASFKKEQSNKMSKKNQRKSVREELIEDVAEEVTCKCVHGTCLPGKSTCNKCDSGWRGKLCQIPVRSDFKANHVGLIEEEEEGKVIFNTKQINDYSVEEQSQPQRRNSGIQEQKVSETLSQETSYIPYSTTRTPDTKPRQQTETGESWISWMFHSFVALVKLVVYILLAVICGFLLKFIIENIQQRFAVTQKKKRIGKRKRQADEITDDGMGLSQNVSFSEDEEENNQPIEMTTVVRRKSSRSGQPKHTNTKQMKNASEISDDQEQELTLFEQNSPQEMTPSQPQDFNPFDDDQSGFRDTPAPFDEKQQFQTNGMATSQEFDNALNEVSDDEDDKDGFKPFI